MVNFMNNELKKDNELTAARLKDKLKEKWPTLDVRSVFMHSHFWLLVNVKEIFELWQYEVFPLLVVR